jgi:hypothetical protein
MHWYVLAAMVAMTVVLGAALVAPKVSWPAARHRQGCRARIERLTERVHREHAEWYR